MLFLKLNLGEGLVVLSALPLATSRHPLSFMQRPLEVKYNFLIGANYG